DLDNLEAAKKLSENYEVKHVPINYMTMMLVDNKNLFMFKSAPLNDITDDSLYLTDAFYTNDPGSSERVFEMLNDTWKRGTEISEITSQAGMNLPAITVSNAQTVSKLVSMMLNNGVNSVLITENDKPVGIISDRDLLKEVVEGKKNPERTLAKDLDYTPLLTLEPGQTMTDALKSMRTKSAKRVAVVKNGQLIAILTQEIADITENNAEKRLL
ncbi:MAG TPA: CBS domain-containing protein, partial [Candidatus Bathyarchaeia archaeon]|nr:CBS domain-containing protein [Candidatus Bathyarchaeia archaeon]